MPAKSKAQQRFMGMVHAVQKGELSPSKVSDKVKDVADNMSDSDAEDFASTKHKGKPEKVAKEVIKKIREILKPIVKESYASMFGEITKHMKSSHEVQAAKELADEYDIGKVLYVFRTNRRAFDKSVKDKMKEMKQFRSAKKLKEGNFDRGTSGLPKGFVDDYTKIVKKLSKGKGYLTLSKSDKKKVWATLGKIYTESINEGGMGILSTDQADVLQGIVMRNKSKNLKALLSIVMKNRMFKGVDKKELLGYIDGARQFVKYMKSHSMESINESAVSFWQDMFRPGPIPKKYINQLIKRKGELPSKKHIKKIYRDNGSPSSSELAKSWKLLTKEKYVRAASGMWRWNKDFTGWESISEGVRAVKAYDNIHKARNEFLERWGKLKKQLNTLKTESPNNEFLRLEKQLYKFESEFITNSSKIMREIQKIVKSNLTESVNEEIAKGKGVQKIFDIQENGYGKLGGKMLDQLSAGLFTQLYDRAPDNIKEKMNKMNEKRLYIIIGKMWKKFGKNVKLSS